MPSVEVDEVELRRLYQLQQIATAMQNHPQAARLVERAMKAIDPTANTPRLDADAAAHAPYAAVRKELDELKAQRQAEKDEAERNAKLAAIQRGIDEGKARLRRAGYTDEGIAGVEKLMSEKGILDVDVAAAAFEKANPPSSPVRPGGSGPWNFIDGLNGETEADLKKLVETKGEFEPLVDRMAREALTDFRGQGRR